jgi:hypothetical protein
MMRPLDILANSPTEEQIVAVHALMVAASANFAKYGDPRTWPERTTSSTGTGPDDLTWDFAWASETNRELATASYDEWVLGAWNHIDGVVKPSDLED